MIEGFYHDFGSYCLMIHELLVGLCVRSVLDSPGTILMFCVRLMLRAIHIYLISGVLGSSSRYGLREFILYCVSALRSSRFSFLYWVARLHETTRLL